MTEEEKPITHETFEKWYKNLPQKQDTTPLTEKKVKELTAPWNKEKDKVNGN